MLTAGGGTAVPSRAPALQEEEEEEEEERLRGAGVSVKPAKCGSDVCRGSSGRSVGLCLERGPPRVGFLRGRGGGSSSLCARRGGGREATRMLS